MSFSTKAVSRKSVALADLERQMMDLIALRRALCLAMASSQRATRSRRSTARVSVKRPTQTRAVRPPSI
jgi:hypothetical protein